MITIDGTEYAEEELTDEAKQRVRRIAAHREQLLEAIMRQQELEQLITFQAQLIKQIMEPSEEDE
jgi:hypothetical protein